MKECENLSKCSFVSCCDEYHKSTAAKGFIAMYCKGSRMEQCVRLRLCNKFGKEIVPKNMMPNGAPLPETTTNDWDIKAQKHHTYLK